MKSSSQPRNKSNGYRNRESVWIYIIICIQICIISVLVGIGQNSQESAESFDQASPLLTRQCQSAASHTGYHVPLGIRNLTLLYTERYVRSSKRMRKHLEAFKEFMALRGREIPQRQDMGVLIVVDGEGTCSDAIVTARAIQDGVGSSLSIVIAYYGSRGCSPASLKYLESALSRWSDVCLMDLSKIEHPVHQRPLYMIQSEKGFGSEKWREAFPDGLIRSMALYHQGFHRVVMLNAGVIPLRDPVRLFDFSPIHGISTWRTLDSGCDEEGIATVQGSLGMDGGIAPCSIDTQHMMVYTAQNWDWIEWTLFLYSYPEYFDQHVGDEAIMRLAFSMVNAKINCSLLPSMVLGNLTSPSQRTAPTWGPIAVMQSHPNEGTPLFLHSLNDDHQSFLQDFTGNITNGWYTTGPIDMDTASTIGDALDTIEKKKKIAIVTDVMVDASDMKNTLRMIEDQIWWHHVFDGTNRTVHPIPSEDMIQVQTAVINARESMPFVAESL